MTRLIPKLIEWKRDYDRSANPSVVIDNFLTLDAVNSNPMKQQERWAQTVQILEGEGFKLPKQAEQYKGFLQYLRASGITQKGRVHDIPTAIAVSHNNRNLKGLGTKKPIAVVVGNKADHNGAFTVKKGFGLLNSLNENGFDVVYVEAATDKEAMAQIKRIHRATGKPIQTLVFAGHGSSETLQLGDYSEIYKKGGSVESGDIDVGDFAWQGDFNGLDKIVAKNGQVLLWACSNGSRKVRNNMVRTVAMKLPGRDVFGVAIDSNIRKIEYSGTGMSRRIRSVDWLQEASSHSIRKPIKIAVHLNLDAKTVAKNMPEFKKWAATRKQESQSRGELAREVR